MSVTRLVAAEKQLTATYVVPYGFLELHAEGEKGFVGAPYFKRDLWVGALKFSLQAVWLGIGIEGQPVKESYTADNKFYITLPVAHQDNDYVFIETLDGLKQIKIDYIYPVQSPADKDLVGVPSGFGPSVKLTPRFYSDVGTPIDKTLYIPGEITISAEVPRQELGPVFTFGTKSSVDITFNDEYIKQVNARAESGKIEWDLIGIQAPLKNHQNPQLVDVTTTKVWIEGEYLITSRFIQPYRVTILNIPTSV